jgi:hypothetical protein
LEPGGAIQANSRHESVMALSGDDDDDDDDDDGMMLFALDERGK